MLRRRIGESKLIGKAEGELERIAPAKWTRVEQLSALIRPTLSQPLTREHAERIAAHLHLHWGTVYK